MCNDGALPCCDTALLEMQADVGRAAKRAASGQLAGPTPTALTKHRIDKYCENTR